MKNGDRPTQIGWVNRYNRNKMLNKELVNYQNKLFWIYRRVKQNQVKEQFIQEIKEMWLCDIVVKHKHNNDDTLLFLREISEVEILN